MPNARDVRPTSHDRHDPILVAALAADDLAGTDRDQALDLTRSCADCALLLDDLRALARGTASAPPVAARPRDFRLTPADVARLRPAGWRRVLGAISGPRSALSRPLGVGIATLGLAGLLIGNVQLDVGGNAASAGPATSEQAGAAPAASAAQPLADAAGGSPSAGFQAQVPANLVPGASAAPASAAAPRASVAASVPPAGSGVFGAATASTSPGTKRDQTVVAGSSGGDQAATAAPESTDTLAARSAGLGDLLRPSNLLFGAAVLIGLGLLVASRRRGDRSV
jgi:hypothetical protein